jgi:FSR family fosmidomycin resistance protein-like MFS transporter
MAGNLGVASASVLAGTLGAAFGWRWALALLAGAGIFLGLRAFTLPSPSLREIQARAGRGNWLPFGLLLVAAIFMGMVYRGMTTFLPKFFAVTHTEDASVGTALGGAMTTAALMIGLVGMYAAGRLADRGMRPAIVFLIGATLQVPFFLAIAWLGGTALLPLAMGVAFFHFFTQPVGNHMVAGFTPPRMRGLGYGIYFFLAFGTGSLGASLGGWISENYGLAASFGALAVVALPAIAAVAALAMMRPREQTR